MRKYIGNILVMVGFILLLSAARVDARRDVAVVIPDYPTVIAGWIFIIPHLNIRSLLTMMSAISP